MPRIDSFLSQLVSYDGDALQLESGDNLYLVKGATRHPLMQVRPGTLAPAHIATLLSEIAPPHARAALEISAPTAFEYVAFERTFLVEVAVVGACLRVLVRPTSRIASSAPARAAAPAADDNGSADGIGEHPLLERAIAALLELGGSDLHLATGLAPMARVDGELRAIAGMTPLEPYALQKLLEPMLPNAVARDLDRMLDVDAAITIRGVRFRCSVFRDHAGLGAVFRVLAAQPPSIEALSLPPALLELFAHRRGIVILAGPAGSGRSTTAAAILDWFNTNRALHIVTLERPVEVLVPSKRSVVHQRDVLEHAGGVERGLRTALRKGADVVYVSDAQDRAAFEVAFDLAAAHRLVILGLTATCARSAVERLLDAFPDDRRAQARESLATHLTAVMLPALQPRLGGGAVASFRVLLGTPVITEEIRAERLAQLTPTRLAAPEPNECGRSPLGAADLDLVAVPEAQPRHALPAGGAHVG